MRVAEGRTGVGGSGACVAVGGTAVGDCEVGVANAWIACIVAATTVATSFAEVVGMAGEAEPTQATATNSTTNAETTSCFVLIMGNTLLEQAGSIAQ